jgi:xanthine dehydrogenase small subunit
MDEYPDATLWAGGTDLGLEVTQGFKQFETIICLQKIKSLTELSENNEESKIGAMVTYSDSIDHLNRFYPAFSHLIDRIAAKQIRNLGTLGGNVANASPIGDTPPVFLALNARVELASSKGTREVSMDEFFTGYKQTVIQPGEYLKAIIIPKLNEHQTQSLGSFLVYSMVVSVRFKFRTFIF